MQASDAFLKISNTSFAFERLSLCLSAGVFCMDASCLPKCDNGQKRTAGAVNALTSLQHFPDLNATKHLPYTFQSHFTKGNAVDGLNLA